MELQVILSVDDKEAAKKEQYAAARRLQYLCAIPLAEARSIIDCIMQTTCEVWVQSSQLPFSLPKGYVIDVVNCYNSDMLMKIIRCFVEDGQLSLAHRAIDNFQKYR
jgi:hypothetical protein